MDNEQRIKIGKKLDKAAVKRWNKECKEKKKTHKNKDPRYFIWIAKVAEILGLPRASGRRFVEDGNWFGCYDDGMTPKEAVDKAKRKGVLCHYLNDEELENIERIILEQKKR